MTTFLIPKYRALGQGFSARERRQARYHAGRRVDGTQSAATWIVNLTDLRKLITLCGFCARKFNPKRHGYRRFYVPDQTGLTNGYACSGVCDACKARLVATGVAFIAEETYAQVCVDPVEQRRRARMTARAAATVWTTIHRMQDSRRSTEAAARKG